MEMKCEDMNVNPAVFNSSTFERKIDTMYITQNQATFRNGS
jgi:hypothetical protein